MSLTRQDSRKSTKGIDRDQIASWTCIGSIHVLHRIVSGVSGNFMDWISGITVTPFLLVIIAAQLMLFL